MRLTPKSLLLATATVAVLAAGTAAGSLVPVPYSSAASSPRVDVLDNGKVVVSVDLAGDLPGLLTLNLQRNADGTVTGQWAAVVAYADTTDPETGEEPAHQAAEQKDFLRLVNRGAMSGAIDAATLTFDANGVLTALTAALSIGQGTLEFTGAAGGTGSATLSQLTLVF